MGTVEIICTVVGTGITIIAAILSGVWFIVRKAQHMAINDYRLNNMENDVSNLKTDVSNLKVDVSLLKTDMSEVKSDISAIKTVLIQKYPNSAVVFSMKKSPRRLNDLGEKVFAQIKGEKFLNENKSFFFSKIDNMNPKTELDVENAANFACSGFTDNDIFNELKDFVYNAPSIMIPGENGESKPYDITLGDVCYILSLPLRDMYLAERFKK